MEDQSTVKSKSLAMFRANVMSNLCSDVVYHTAWTVVNYDRSSVDKYTSRFLFGITP